MNSKCLIPFVVSLSNHGRNRFVQRLPNPLTLIGQRGGVTRHRVLEIFFAAKVLPVGIFQPLRDNRFIGACEGMFEVMKTGNQSRGQARSTLLFGKKLTERIIQYFPINQVSQLIKFVFWI